MEELNEIYEELANQEIDATLYPFNEIIDEIGFEAVLVLTKKLGGSSIYIPSMRTILKKQIDKTIREEFNGGNYKELGRKYELCERSIRNIVNSK